VSGYGDEAEFPRRAIDLALRLESLARILRHAPIPDAEGPREPAHEEILRAVVFKMEARGLVAVEKEELPAPPFEEEGGEERPWIAPFELEADVVVAYDFSQVSARIEGI
jgi:hypothetical protein